MSPGHSTGFILRKFILVVLLLVVLVLFSPGAVLSVFCLIDASNDHRAGKATRRSNPPNAPIDPLSTDGHTTVQLQVQ